MKNYTENKYPLICVVAMTHNNIIGDGKKLLWHLPDDLKRLKKITIGNPIIMGRKTFQSIGKPLSGRVNIILTHKKNWAQDGVIPVNNLDQAIQEANLWIDKYYNHLEKKNKNIYIFGGGEIYKMALNHCKKIEMTLVDFKIGKGIKFPKLNYSEWNRTLIEKKAKSETCPSYSFWLFERKLI